MIHRRRKEGGNPNFAGYLVWYSRSALNSAPLQSVTTFGIPATHCKLQQHLIFISLFSPFFPFLSYLRPCQAQIGNMSCDTFLNAMLCTVERFTMGKRQSIKKECRFRIKKVHHPNVHRFSSGRAQTHTFWIRNSSFLFKLTWNVPPETSTTGK